VGETLTSGLDEDEGGEHRIESSFLEVGAPNSKSGTPTNHVARVGEKSVVPWT
jgi:hypothetical protein